MTTPKTDTWMPLWIGDYLADTMRLSTAQHGAYLLLLMAYWREKGPLADNDEELRSIVRADAADWPNLRKCLKHFFKVTGGFWHHGRVDQELEDAATRKAAAVARASAGGMAAKKRREESASSTASSSATRTAQAVLGECSSPSPLRDTPPPPAGVAPLTPESAGKPSKPPKPAKPPPTKDVPASFLVTVELQRWARETVPLVDIRQETEIFRRNTFGTARSDWPKTWQQWMLKEQKHLAKAATPRPLNAHQQMQVDRHLQDKQWNDRIFGRKRAAEPALAAPIQPFPGMLPPPPGENDGQ